MCTISVIIPYYKNASTIVRSLESVVNQTIKDLEIILINDASPDWPLAENLIQKFKDYNLRILHHSKNLNGAAARNTGISKAKGKYIAFLDADDEWNSDHLRKSLICMDSNCDLVFSKFLVKSNIEYILPNCNIDEKEKIGDFLFVKQQAIFTPSIFVKADVARQILFDEKLQRHQDYDFLLRFEAAGYKVKLSEHIGGTVHWEDNNPTAKGGTWENSLKWVKENRIYLTDKAYTNFIVQFIITKLLSQSDYKLAFKLFTKECNIKLITKKNLKVIIYPVYAVLSAFFMGKKNTTSLLK